MGRFEPPSAIGSVKVGRPDRNSVTVFVSGEQDQSNVGSLRSALTLASAMADRVVIDLGEATFISAALLGAVVSARASLCGRGAELTVRSPSPMARRVFELSGLNGLIDEGLRSPVATPAEALRPLRRPGAAAVVDAPAVVVGSVAIAGTAR